MNFDNASTTQPLPEVLDEYLHISRAFYANPASLHAPGISAEGRILTASKTLARLIGAAPDELVFTSGGTEANNLAVFGVCEVGRRRHIITTKSEHPSVSEACKRLEQKGFEVTWLPTDTEGRIGLDTLAAAVREDTALVSLMHVNNETGTVCDIARAAEVVKAQNPATVFHSDGVQAFGKLRVSLRHIDLYSMSAHKLHAPRGIGALYVKKGTKLRPQVYGGGQQRGLRSGTENTAGVCAFALAAERIVRQLEANDAHVREVKKTLAGITDELDDVRINGDSVGSPYILNMSFLGVKAEVLLHCLEQDGIYVSTGSACGAKHSHNILGHYGLDAARVESALRFSFSYENTREEAEAAKASLLTHVRNLRAMRR